MDNHEIEIEWEGPLTIKETTDEKNDAGEPPDYGGNDYGLYQIYGEHILCGSETLLYIGKTTEQTFSARIKQHLKDFLKNEGNIKVFLGRIYDPKRHCKKENWKTWRWDVDIAERILIYKYCPNYNGRGIGDLPSLMPHTKILLKHKGESGRLQIQDNAPADYS